jgi:hypothetical protein
MKTLLGEHQVKNISTPIRIYQILSFPGAAAHRVAKAKTTMKRKWRKVALVVAVVLVLCVGAVLIWNFYLRPTSVPVEVTHKTQPKELSPKAPTGLSLS